ncbi:MAG: hypothetical protein V2I35_14650 [Desulfocapsaceae bacterium]|jgi:hypothetical protein|nr:hypothetical protein [Desulfocapsaceae bacterium]
MNQNLQEIDQFISLWPDSSKTCRDLFVRLKDHLLACEDVTVEFVARPGVTYSLRAVHAQQHDRPLFTMVDVIEDEPRWLSICFYGEMVRDPEEQGDFVPGGLLGEDGICFDVESGDEQRFAYVLGRIDEAYRVAAAS